MAIIYSLLSEVDTYVLVLDDEVGELVEPGFVLTHGYEQNHVNLEVSYFCDFILYRLHCCRFQ